MKADYESADVERAWKWYRQHKSHVDGLMKSTKVAFPMSGSDIGRPELWKPGAWNWFFRWNAEGASRLMEAINERD